MKVWAAPKTLVSSLGFNNLLDLFLMGLKWVLGWTHILEMVGHAHLGLGFDNEGVL